jgi:carbamoyltransferase
MKILGVTNTPDSGAALIVDGRIVAAANEERFTRVKLTREFPTKSIEYVLSTCGLSISDIDWVGCGCWRGIDQAVTLPRLIEDVFDQADSGNPIVKQQVMSRIAATAKRDAEYKDGLYRNLTALGVREERIQLYDHHYSHAMTAYYPSPFDEALVYTADGRGDCRSVTLWSASRAGGLELMDSATELTSPGALYGFITKVLGFIPDRHEGKVTGLAAHGKMSRAYDILKSGFFYDEERGRLVTRIGDCYRPFVGADLEELKRTLAQFSREDIAFAVQHLLETTLVSFLKRHIGNRPEKSVDLCLAGGCMSNVKLNYELSRLPQIRNVYIFPQMGDGGNALGGAIGVGVHHYGLQRFDLPTAYLGPSYGDDEIEAALRSANLEYRRIDPACKGALAAELIASGQIVGWFQGRMEYGPRALGSRSILATATDSAINATLNKRLQRTEFMPFAPVTVAEQAGRCFVGWKEDQIASQFMTICYDCTPFMADRCPGVVHVDNTARPQVVFRDKNPEYHDAISRYVALTGNPTIVNTSFNHHEEPIVNTPGDAIRSLKKGNVDTLLAGNFVIKA